MSITSLKQERTTQESISRGKSDDAAAFDFINKTKAKAGAGDGI